MAKPMQVGYVEIGHLCWPPPTQQQETANREIAADYRRCPSGIPRGLPVTESQGRCGIPTASCLLVLLCRTATHSSCRDPYSETAIETALMVRLVFHQPLRQTEG